MKGLIFSIPDKLYRTAIERCWAMAKQCAIEQIMRGLAPGALPVEREKALRACATLHRVRPEPWLGPTIGVVSVIVSFSVDGERCRVSFSHPEMNFVWEPLHAQAQVRLINLCTTTHRSPAIFRFVRRLCTPDKRSFFLHDTEYAALASWEHWDAAAALSPRYQYQFRNTSLGITRQVIDTVRNRKIDVTDVSDW